jgi:hypothetical protein
MLDLEATKERIAAMVKLAAMHTMEAIKALAMDMGLGDVPATLKKTPPMTATPSAALICSAELVMPAIIPEPVAGARSMTERTSVGSAQP